jgi:hypothetical protein
MSTPRMVSGFAFLALSRTFFKIQTAPWLQTVNSVGSYLVIPEKVILSSQYWYIFG